MRSSRLLCYVGRDAPLLHSLGFRHLPSDSLLLRLSSKVLRIQKATLHPLVHLGDGPTIPLRVRLGILLARGVILLPARGVGSWKIRLPMNDSAAAGPSVSWRQPYAFAPDQPTSISSGRSFRQGGESPPPPPYQKPRLPVDFHLMMSADPLRFSYYRTKERVT